MLEAGIEGIECYYSRYNADEIKFLVDCAKENNLLISGGSDYHGDEGTRARMGRLPCGWHALEHDIAALTAAMALATPSDHLQKEQQDV